MNLWIRCQPRSLVEKSGKEHWRSTIEISRARSSAEIDPPYSTMCAVIDNFIHDRFAEEVLRDIEEIQRGDKQIWEEGTEAYTFWMTRDGVTFEFQYGEHGPEKAGEVTLDQFKFAVQIYLRFLRDPERKPIEVPFPE